MKRIFKNKIIKNVILAVTVAGFGFIILNLTFLFDFLFQSLAIDLIKLFTPSDIIMTWYWFPPAMHVLFVIIIGLISWAVSRSKLRTTFKAIYLFIPIAVVLVTIGMFLYPWPIAAYSLGIIFTLGVLLYCYRTKQPWIYYYSVILISVILLVNSLIGGDI